MTSGDDAIHAITLPVRDWLRIDAALDNKASIMSGIDDRQATALSHIRKIGWQILPDWPTEPHGFKYWPAAGHQVTIPLTRAQWELIATTLEYWATLSAEQPQPEEPAASPDSESASEHTIANALRRQLAQPPH